MKNFMEFRQLHAYEADETRVENVATLLIKYSVCYKFLTICRQKSIIKKSGNGLGFDVCHLENSLENNGCEIYFDRFFNSVPLMIELLKIELNCGTLNINWKFLPPSIKNINLMNGCSA